MHALRQWIYRFVSPRATNEDRARREFILNILLCGSIALIFLATLVNFVSLVRGSQDTVNALPLVSLLGTLLFFIGLYVLSRRGLIMTASILLLSAFFAIAAFMGYRWGVDLQAAILLFVLIIVMAGILIGSRAAFIATSGIGLFLFAVNHVQRTGMVETIRSWRNGMWSPGNIIVVVIIFGIIAIVSWLSNREITRALARARHSEGELKKERDLLEVKVEERTKALKAAQMEKMEQLYRFAEFGRLSSGLFHDLTNHLSALSFNVEQAHRETSQLAPATAQIEEAMRVSRNMRDFVHTIRKQIAGAESITLFSLNDEIKETIQLVAYKARAFDVSLEFVAVKPITIFGNSTKYGQIVANLVGNAIDTYAGYEGAAPRRVRIELGEIGEGIQLTVTDWGSGIPDEIQSKIFEPFFTTKDFSRGTGLGLSITKRIVEKDFGGTIAVESQPGRYTTFRILFPTSLYAAPALTQPPSHHPPGRAA